MERFFTILPETSAIYPVWKRLVVDHEVRGKPAHDAKLAAAMYVHGISSILTFDKSGFSRYPGIKIFDPVEVFQLG
jgi:predicted nucleic acid-binding protein